MPNINGTKLSTKVLVLNGKAEKDKEGTEKKPAAKKVEKVAEGEAEEVAEEATEEQ